MSTTIIDTAPVKKITEIEKNNAKIIGRCFELSEETDNVIGIKTGEGFLVHYYIELLKDNEMALEMVGEKGEPSGNIIDHISIEDFSKRFKTCSEHYCPLRTKTVDEISEKMAETRTKLGEDLLSEGKLEEAEDKFSRALQFDEKSIRASLGLGKTKLEQDKVEEAMEIFNTIKEETALYEQSNKHTLNEYAIYLRKKDLFDLAIESYEKAIGIDQTDEILFYNLGKAYAARGLRIANHKEGLKNIQKGIGIVREALHIKEDFPDAAKFLEKLLKDEQNLFNFVLSGKTETTHNKKEIKSTLQIDQAGNQGEEEGEVIEEVEPIGDEDIEVLPEKDSEPTNENSEQKEN